MEIGFLLKKILSLALMPLSLGIMIGIVGFIYLYINHYKKAKIFLTISFLWIVLISNNGFSKLMINPLNNHHAYLSNIPKDIKYILLLGGDITTRGWEALRLYHKIPNAKIITSGYEGIYNMPEAIINANILIQSGIPKEDIIMHTTPKDTKEEAIIMKKFIKEKPFFLVTASYHMPRAFAIFEKEGLHPIVAPTLILGNKEVDFISVSSGNSLHKTEIAWHEYLGLMWAKLRNQI
jgi:uncharacterized SAM-binding protein YcdF (DUF218 family)